ncbi:MAG: non-canonical purine NTP pyrophosphatase [Candidatus Stahlbacteria bacterium]|nr:non-canonical purine NTP pyrophosphatase [Candidatus Stahlbacteria bacterium]
MDIVIATQNLDKFREITYILKELVENPVGNPTASGGVKFSNLADIPMPSETGNTLEENAIMKAEYGFKITNKISIADDSGLEVAALNGLPGVYSARFAGIGATYKANRDKLLHLLVEADPSRWTWPDAPVPTQNVSGECVGRMYREQKSRLGRTGQSMENRKAKFRCVVAVTGIQGEQSKLFDGKLNGYITYEDKGELGFGYDPIFFVPELGKTLAELPTETKNQISHRALAFLKVKEYLLKEMSKLKD